MPRSQQEDQGTIGVHANSSVVTQHSGRQLLYSNHDLAKLTQESNKPKDRYRANTY